MAGAEENPDSPGDRHATPSDVSPESTDLTTTAVTSFIWAFVSLVGNRAVVFITTLLLVRLLTPEDFGTVAAALVVLGFLNIGFDSGFGAALIQEQSTGFGRRAETAFTLHVAASVVGCGALIAVAPLLASGLGIPDDVDVLRVLAASLVLRALGKTHESLLQRDLKFRLRAIVAFSRAVVRLCVSVGLALSGAGVWALVMGLLASEASATLGLWILIPFRPKLRIVRSEVVSLFQFGAAVTGTRLASAVMTSADDVAIANRLGPKALGYYVLAYRLPELILENVLTTFSQVAFPVLSRARQASESRLHLTTLRSLTFVTLFGFTAATGLALIAEDFITILFDDIWLESSTPMALLALAMGISSVGYGVGDLYLALGKPRVNLAISAAMTGPFVISFFLAAPHGLVAVASVHLVANVILMLIELTVVFRLAGISISACALALRGPTAATAGLLILAAPIRFGLQPGLTRLTLVVVAGLVGAAIGATVADRSLPATLKDLAMAARQSAR